jgi:hypothetical protein
MSETIEQVALYCTQLDQVVGVPRPYGIWETMYIYVCMYAIEHAFPGRSLQRGGPQTLASNVSTHSPSGVIY